MKNLLIGIIILLSFTINAQEFIGLSVEASTHRADSISEMSIKEHPTEGITEEGVSYIATIIDASTMYGYDIGLYFLKINGKFECTQEFHTFQWEALFNSHVSECRVNTTERESPNGILNIMYVKYTEVTVNCVKDFHTGLYIIVYKNNDYINKNLK